MTDASPETQPSFASLDACLDWVGPRLRDAHAARLDSGHPDDMPWWPAGFARERGERAFEIAVGAVLTQNTNWRNVERALANLDEADALDAATIHSMADATLAELIRPSGFFRIKAGRLKALSAAWETAGGYPVLAEWETAALRDWLLAVYGVGRETADDILLYGFGRPVWVIDAYTRRLVGRLGFEEIAARPYDRLAEELLAHTPEPTAERLAEWHGLIVEHAKAHCRVKPACDHCPLRPGCRHGREAVGASRG